MVDPPQSGTYRNKVVQQTDNFKVEIVLDRSADFEGWIKAVSRIFISACKKHNFSANKRKFDAQVIEIELDTYTGPYGT
jgi:hypothetical protein